MTARPPQNPLRRSKDAAINDARRICARYVGGESEQQIIQDMLAGSPGMSLDTAAGFADTAISVYCPGGYIDQPVIVAWLLTVAGQEVTQPLDGVSKVA
jgi:uncharacterized protein DUF732